MKTRSFALCAIALAVSACGGSTGENTENMPGSVSISGTALQGETLTANVTDGDGIIDSTLRFQWRAGSSSIQGATSASYVLSADEVGDKISVVASYTDNGNATETLLSVATDEVARLIVNFDGSVAISGSVIVGETLNAVVIDQNGATGDIEYTWMADGVEIDGASESSLALGAAQLGAMISVMVTYTDDEGFEETLLSADTVPVIQNTVGTVAISGMPVAGNVLSAQVTDADGITSDISYQWKLDDSAIEGADDDEYTLLSSQIGQAISLVVSYTDDLGFEETITAPALTVVAPVAPAVNQAGVITLSGGRTPGSVLTASVTDGNGLPASLTYTWLANGVTIAGATGNTFTLGTSEIGTDVTVNARYTDNDAFVENLTSAPISVIAPPAVNVAGTVTISGSPLVGNTLTAAVTDDNGITTAVNYQWMADGVAISGATNSSFVLTSAQAGASISVMASYTDNASNAESVTSASTSAVVSNTVGMITISGTTTEGNVLTAAVTDSDGTSTSSIAYQWLGDGTAIAGATASTFSLTSAQVGQQITVSATYTDDEGFDETIVSTPSAQVMAGVTNTAGVLTVSDSEKIAVGVSVVTNLSDANMISTIPTYVWMADGVVISGATSDQYVPVDADIGKVLSVSVTYTDDDGFNESLSASADAFVHTIITESLSELVAAADSASDGDIIGIDDGNYANTDRTATANQIRINDDNMRVVRVQNSTAVLSGAMCFEVQGDNNIIEGLRFENINSLDGSDCISSGGSAITIRGDNVIFRNNTIDSEGTFTTSGEFSWIALRGVGNTITRNIFTDNSGQKVTTRGGVISVYTNQTANNNQDHTITYNLFKDFGDSVAANLRDSSAYMIQLGRSTGTDSRGTQNTRVEHNLFTNVNIDRRLMKVQSSENHINHNTILDSSGMIALEDGENNEASNNVIISSQSNNSDDGGISFGPYGHTITNNYIAGLRTTSGDRAGLYANSTVIGNSGNTGLSIATVTVANNSIFNSRQPVQFEDGCTGGQFILDFDNNLIAQDEDGVAGDDDNLGLASNGASNAAFRDDCDLNAASDFDNTHVYADAISTSNVSGRTPPDLFNSYASNGADNRFGPRESSTEPGATTEQNANGLWESVAGSVDDGVGVDADLLRIITEDQVGAGSTTTF